MFLSLITNASFLRLCAAQFIALAAGYVVHFISAILIENLTHASGPMGGLVITAIVPGMLAGLWAGGLVDRYNRIYLLAASLGLRGLVSVLFLLPVASGAWLPVVYLVNFLLSVLVQFAMTAEAALLPDLVDKRQLLAANGIFGINVLAAQGMGILVVGPALLQTDGLAATGGLAILGFLAAMLLVATLLRQPEISPRHWLDRLESDSAIEYRASPAAVSEALIVLRAGWHFTCVDRPTRRAAIHLALMYTLLMVVVTLLPGFLVRVVGRPVADLTILALPAGSGFGLGVWIVGRYGHKFDARRWSGGGLALAGLALASMASWQGESVVSGLTFAALTEGFCLALVIIPARSILQSRPPAALRGRVWATQVVLSNAVALLPILLSGSLADRVGIRFVLFLTALTVLVVGLTDISTRLTNSFLKRAR